MRKPGGLALVLLSGLAVFGPGGAAVQAAKEGGEAGSPSVASPSATSPTATVERIDREIEHALAGEKVTPGPIADDAEFLRRVTLDLTGVIPSPDRAADFLDSSEPDKRARLIDELLASPLYGRHLADLW